MFRLPAFAAILLATFSLAARAAEPTRIRDVVYGRTSGLALTLDVLKPEKPNGAGVLFMVSGGFNSDIAFLEGGVFSIHNFAPFLDRGDTVFLVTHGSQPRFTVGEIVTFIHRAVRFVRTHAAEYSVDPNRLGIMGISSGGYLSLMMATAGAAGDAASPDAVNRASSRVQAAACFCPPSDLVDYGQPGRTIVEFKPVEFVWPAFGVQGKPRDEQVKILRDLSPITHISADDPPTLIIQGDRDELVPFEQTPRFVAKLKEAGVPAEVIVREGAGHGWPTMPADFALLADWFDKHLKSAADVATPIP